MSDSAQIALITILVPIVFPVVLGGLFVLVLTLMSAISGWGRIAAAYPGTKVPAGMGHVMVGASIGGISYRNALTVHVSDKGINLFPMTLLGFAHPPIFVPWSAMHNVRDIAGLFGGRTSFEVGSPRVGTITLSQKLMARRPRVAA